ncbi:MAG: sigma-54-dependent Fis family transcriptional regulator [Rhodobacteraceae bacterium]|nr:sigma-54-dependent Fis family transcriptional regulator [Paracoccaceae bacterium]
MPQKLSNRPNLCYARLNDLHCGQFVASADQHTETIQAAIAGDGAARQPLVASWQRSSLLHELDPGHQRPPERLTDQELRTAQEQVGLLISTSEVSLDQLYLAVGDVGCSVVLADAHGVAIARRGAPQDDEAFHQWGLWTGAVWSEKSEGTNGVGTCIVEERPLTIHKDQHFHAKNTGLSCTAAPIFDHEGELMAVVDVSSCRADLTAGFSRLISAAVVDTARRIETDHFRARFPAAKIILATDQDGQTARTSAALLAVNGDDLVIGATRGARTLYGLSKADMKTARPLASLQGQDIDQAKEYAMAEHRIIQQALASSGGNVSAAARAMGISRATLHRKLKKFGGPH